MRAWVDRASAPGRMRSRTSTRRPARASSIAVALPATRAPTDDDVPVGGAHAMRLPSEERAGGCRRGASGPAGVPARRRRTAASRPIPARKLELRVVCQRCPTTYRPGEGVSPWRCRTRPVASSTGTCSHGWLRPAARWPRAPCGCRSPSRSSLVGGRDTVDRRRRRARHPAGRPEGRGRARGPRRACRNRARRASASAVVSRRSSANRTRAPRMPVSRPGEAHAAGRERGEAEVACVLGAPGVAGELERRLAQGGGGVGDPVDPAVEAAQPLHPPVDVDAAVGAHHAGVPADGEHDVAARCGELVGELHPGRRRPHHEDATVGQLRRPAVGVGRQLVDVGRQPRRRGPAPRARRRHRWRPRRRARSRCRRC